MSNVMICTLLLSFIAVPIPLSADTTAQNTSAIVALRQEVAELRRIIATQDKRIKALEALVEKAPASKKRAILSGVPWHKESNWKKIKRGMSRQQVEAILGKPTRVDEYSGVALFYEGEVAGSGYVVGVIKLWDNRVSIKNVPVFLTM